MPYYLKEIFWRYLMLFIRSFCPSRRWKKYRLVYFNHKEFCALPLNIRLRQWREILWGKKPSFIQIPNKEFIYRRTRLIVSWNSHTLLSWPQRGLFLRDWGGEQAPWVENKAENKRKRRAKGIIRDNRASHSLDEKMDLHKFSPGKDVAKL